MEMTPWFPTATALPARCGVYNVSCRSERQSGEWFAYFDGTRFRYYHCTPAAAFANREDVGCGGLTKSWRGLTSATGEAA